MPTYDPEDDAMGRAGRHLRSVEALASDGHPEDAAGEALLEGTTRQLSFKGLGPAPTSASLTVKKTEVFLGQGQFKKLEVIPLIQRVEVDDIQFPTVRDADKFVIGHERKHIAEVRSTEIASVQSLCHVLAVEAAKENTALDRDDVEAKLRMVVGLE